MSLKQDAGADQRWAAARSLADGGIDERMPRRRRTVWLWLAAVLVAGVILGVVLGVAFPPSASTGRPDAGWLDREVLGLAMQTIGLMIVVGGVIWAICTRRCVARWKQVASPLSAPERTWLRKQIRSLAPIDDWRRSVVLAVAAQNRRVSLGLVPMYFGLALSFFGTVVGSRWEMTLIFPLIGALAFLASFVLLAVDYRRSGAYLKRFGGVARPHKATA